MKVIACGFNLNQVLGLSFCFGDTTSKHKSPRTIQKPNTICFLFSFYFPICFMFSIFQIFLSFFFGFQEIEVYHFFFFFFRFKATINFNGEKLLDVEPLISTRFVYQVEAGCVCLLFCHTN